MVPLAVLAMILFAGMAMAVEEAALTVENPQISKMTVENLQVEKKAEVANTATVEEMNDARSSPTMYGQQIAARQEATEEVTEEARIENPTYTTSGRIHTTDAMNTAENRIEANARTGPYFDNAAENSATTTNSSDVTRTTRLNLRV